MVLEVAEEAQTSRMASLGACLTCVHLQIAAEYDVGE
jgi:hypothetical protein